jgi:superfamily II DNA or RNA helicase
MPISWKGTLVQYAGRLHRLHPTKTEVRIFDYVDEDVPVLRRMFAKRLRAYGAMGYAPTEAHPATGNAPLTAEVRAPLGVPRPTGGRSVRRTGTRKDERGKRLTHGLTSFGSLEARWASRTPRLRRFALHLARFELREGRRELISRLPDGPYP